MHFRDSADLCEHPHGQHRAWYVTRSIASSVAFMVLERSQCSNMVERGTALSTDYFPTDLCGDFALAAEAGAHITFQAIGWLLQGESFTFQYNKFFLPMIKELLCVEVAFLMAVGKVSSPDSPPDMCCPFMNPTLSTKHPSVEYLLYICNHQLHTTHNNKEKIWHWVFTHHGFVTCLLLHRLPIHTIMPSHRMQI